MARKQVLAWLLLAFAVCGGLLGWHAAEQQRGAPEAPVVVPAIAERFANVAVRIVEVGGRSVVDDDPPVVPGRARVEGDVEHLPPTGEVWLVVTELRNNRRRIFGPAAKHPDERWELLLPLPQARTQHSPLVLEALATATVPFLDVVGNSDGRIVVEREWRALVTREDVRLSLPSRVVVAAEQCIRITSVGPLSASPWAYDEASTAPLDDAEGGGRGAARGEGAELIVQAREDIRGEATGFPSGSRLYAVLHRPGGDSWRVAEPTAPVGTDGTWTLVGVSFEDPDAPLESHFEVRALVSERHLRPGPITYRGWTRRAIMVSDPLRVMVGQRESARQAAGLGSLWVNRIGQQRPANGLITNVEQGDEIVGGHSGLPPGSRIWVLVRPKGREEWYALPGDAERPRHYVWKHPDARFRAGVSGATAFEVTAVASPEEPPGGRFSYEQRQRITYASSAPVNATLGANQTALLDPSRPVPARRGSSGVGWLRSVGAVLDEAGDIMRDNLFTILVAVLAAALLTGLVAAAVFRRPGAVISLCRPAADLLDEMIESLSPVDCLRALGHTAIGVLIVSVLLNLMFSFFPSYAAMLQRVLGATGDQSHGYAKLVMGSTAMAGVFVHFMLEFSGKLQSLFYGEGEQPKASANETLDAIWPVLLVMTGCLWLFQGIVIGASMWAGAHSPLAAAAGFLFGLFWSCIETAGFWMGTRFLFPAVTLWPPYILALGPRALCKAAESRTPVAVEITAIDGQPADQSEIGVAGQVQAEGTIAGLPISSQVWTCVFDERGVKLLDWSRCEVDGGRWCSTMQWQDEGVGVGSEFVVQAVVSTVEPNKGRPPLARSKRVKVVRRSPAAGEMAP